MRVNHVGEVCAQALYTGQALGCKDPALRQLLNAACREETDHLAWTAERLAQLDDRPSLLNPLWYAGAFAMGLAASTLGGDRVSLGFVVETERQVEAHLDGHMEQLPANDLASRAIVQHMKTDEVAHARMAERAGAGPLAAAESGHEPRRQIDPPEARRADRHPRRVGENLVTLLPNVELHSLGLKDYDLDLSPRDEWNEREPALAKFFTDFMARVCAASAA
jgi:hypothetical protein